MSRHAWAIALRDLYAQLFRNNPHYVNLTRWADLEEELMKL